MAPFDVQSDYVPSGDQPSAIAEITKRIQGGEKDVVLLGATQNFSPVGSTFPLNYLRGAGTTLTNFVYEASPTGNLNQPQKAYAAAFVLLLMVLALNAAVDIVHRRARKAGTWSH